MNLQDFVSETLVQLVEGIRDAQSRLSPLGAKVNPAGFRVLPERGQNRFWNNDTGESIDVVDFDVALTTGKGTEGREDLQVAQPGKTTESHSRVSFNVPVYLPVQRN